MRGKGALVLLGCAALAFRLCQGLAGVILPARTITGPAEHYLAHGAAETGSANLVSAILFDYRGLDTLGEVAVIFAAVTGTALLFGGTRIRYGFSGLSVLVKLGMALVLPFIVVYAVSIMVFGHLTPGGGFQGGTVFATVTILLCIVYGAGFERLHFKPRLKEFLEAGGGLLFIGAGLAGLVAGGAFLSNLSAGFPKGTIGSLVSGGFIPLLNIIVGIKVGAGLASLFFSMVKDLDAGETEDQGHNGVNGEAPPS
jgi:multicomponent Na+:H+ antiporter subunit B